MDHHLPAVDPVRSQRLVDVRSPRLRSLLRDYGRMFAVGGVSLLVDFGLFNVLLAWGWAAAWANAVALTVAGLIAFLGNLSFTFAHRDIPKRSVALGRFIAVAIVSVLVVEIAVALAGHLGADVAMLNAVKAAVTVGAVGGRFVLYREWVYRHSQP